LEGSHRKSKIFKIINVVRTFIFFFSGYFVNQFYNVSIGECKVRNGSRNADSKELVFNFYSVFSVLCGKSS